MDAYYISLATSSETISERLFASLGSLISRAYAWLREEDDVRWWLMKAVVAHHLWSRVGGGELVNAYVVKTLLEAGYETAIVSTFGFNKKSYEEWFGITLDHSRIYALLPRMLPLFGIYQRLGFYIPLKRAIKDEKPDLVFVDCELYKPIIKLRKRMRFKILEYIHFPFHALKFEKGEVPREYKKAYEEYLSDAMKYHAKYKKGLWKHYFNLWLKLYSLIARDNPFETADVVMVNSNYIGRLVKMLWKGDPVVLYPPVKVKDFTYYGIKFFDERDDSVVMIGRVSPEKRIEYVINALALTDNKPVLRIIGGFIPATLPYKRTLEKMAEEKGVKIEFYLNIPRNEMVKIATSSKIFVHSTIGEHFGIAVVEGMAAGCPVIVHKSGGPFEDIIEQGVYGLYYSSVEDLAEKISKLLNDRRAWEYYHVKSLQRSLQFSEELFSRNLLKIIK
jgi:glycosyltransferase involved in cell wall biosynthesis